MRKHNVMDVVHPQDDELNIVKLETWDSQGRAVVDYWSVRCGRYVLECEWCGEFFLSDRPHTKYHSKACRQAAYRARKSEVQYV